MGSDESQVVALAQELTKAEDEGAEKVQRRIESGKALLTIYGRIKALYEEHVPGKLARLNLIWAKYKGE